MRFLAGVSLFIHLFRIDDSDVNDYKNATVRLPLQTYWRRILVFDKPQQHNTLVSHGS